MIAWVGSDTLSVVAGISERKARAILMAFANGRTEPWHGAVPVVREVHGRGGRSGIQYVAEPASLPPAFQMRLQEPFEALSKTRLGQGAQLERNWKYDVIRPALAFPKGSRERGKEIAKIDGTKRLDWKGKQRRLSKSVLYKWIELFEREGVHALARPVRSDKGKRRVWVSRAWATAVPFDEKAKATIHEDLKQYVRGLIAGGSQRSQIYVLASEKLMEMTAAYGFRLNDPRREKHVFSIPSDFVQEEQHFKAVYRRRSDRKAHEDDKPRIRRSIAGLLPMDVVVADIHHMNVRLLRDDGTTATPKMIAFFDVATERFYFEFVLFERRAGVLNRDVIRVYMNMCQATAFGQPKKLYFDNGSEYRFADQLEDALKLGVEFGDLDEIKSVHRAKPYNAAAKRIEGGFRELNQHIQRHIPGWIDDDRMRPKGRKLGKAHAPYDGGFEAFCGEFRQLMLSYDNMPKSGALKGKSPNERFREFVEAGWRANVLNPEDFLTVFTRIETRVVRKHGIDADGRTWLCDGLLGHFGKKVQVHIPLYGFGFNMLKVCDLNGREIGIATPDQEYSYFDPRGAQESARRSSIREKELTKLAKSVPQIDVKAELIAYGEKQVPVIPNEPDGVVSVNRNAGAGNQVIMPAMTKQKTRAQEEEEFRLVEEACAALTRANKLATEQKRKAS